MSITMNVHRVTRVNVEPHTLFNGSVWRRFIFHTADGGAFTVTAFPADEKTVPVIIEPVPCEHCAGTGETEISIGGDGYGDACCASADVPTDCGMCDGTGIEPDTVTP